MNEYHQYPIKDFQMCQNDPQVEDKTPLRIELEPSWEDYEMVKTLGQGTYGRVFKVKKKNVIATPKEVTSKKKVETQKTE